MFFTLFYLVVFFSKNDKIYANIQNTDNDFELFEIDNILNNPHNPVYFENFWNNIYKELLYVLFLFLAISLCLYFDINYILNKFF
jgi:hypothetical protein